MSNIRYLEAVPSNGDLTHAIVEHDGEIPGVSSGQTRVGFLFTFARALCGVRGRDSWGGGGMKVALNLAKEPIEFDSVNPAQAEVGWDGRAINKVCPRCLARVRRARADAAA